MSAPYNPSAPDDETVNSPLLSNSQSPIIQPVVVTPNQQQPYYGGQQLSYQQPMQPQQQIVYQQPMQPQQQQYVYQQQQPQYQTQQGFPQQPQQQYQQQQPQQILSGQQQNSGEMPSQQHQPTDQQLGEGVGSLPSIVVAPTEPIRVSGSQDGVGMAEGCRRNPHVLTWILTIGIWLTIFSIAICNIGFSSYQDGYCGFFVTNVGAAFGIIAGLALIYYIECYCTGTGQYLRHILEKEGAAQWVERLKGEPAQIWWNVACYHWETRRRQRTVKDANGNTRTEWETYQEKVYTWRATQQYVYATCIDVSGQLVGLDIYTITKLRLRKTYGFVDLQSQQHYVTERRLFRMFNWRDVHQEFHEEYKINGFVDRILAESEPGIKPGWMSSSCYWICNLFFLSPCFRHKMSASCGNAEYMFVKQLSCT